MSCGVGSETPFLASTLIHAGLVEGLLDKNGPWVLLGVFSTCVACCGGLLDEGEGRPAVLSREFRRTDHVNCMKQETFLSGV